MNLTFPRQAATALGTGQPVSHQRLPVSIAFISTNMNLEMSVTRLPSVTCNASAIGPDY